MIQVTLPDGSSRSYETPQTVEQIAQSIAPSLAKAAIAATVKSDTGIETTVDTSYVVDSDVSLSIITPKDDVGLDIIRHSTAHLLAHAVKELFPDAQVTIGPVINNGFYYDFSYKRPFTPEDLQKIEKRMSELVKQDIAVIREEWDRDEAIEFFKKEGELYKAEIISSIPQGEVISLYRQGSFVDLCRGPHVPSTGKLKVFKLMKVAGAYWRGDSNNEMLQRVYGTAWSSKDDQVKYLTMLEEAEKRDHRKLGKELDLFHFQDEAPGLIFWHPKGWTIWQQVEQFMRKVYVENGYQEIKAPQILDLGLWKKTGHWDNYKENMFTTQSENREYGLKPMNCPGHVQIYNSTLHSYRELPIRYGEFGQCHRNEPSGSLHGMMRVRGFTQDDGHIFCTEDQLLAECLAFTALLQKVYKEFGFTEVLYKIATRPEKRIGADEIWDKAEKALMESLKQSGCEFEISPGEGAFYGPKIEYTLKDAIGRHWQCGTIQVDFSMPARLGAEYVDADDTRKTPVMLHRAILGSLERFIGMLIENYSGAMPPWLSPEHVVVCPISEAFNDYALEVQTKLNQKFRVKVDLRNEKITKKIRENSMQKIPYILVVGEKERSSSSVAVRARGNIDLGVLTVDDFIARLQNEIDNKLDVVVPSV
ncbi:threonine--tRNA ligase [Taylorella equigenitalis]|uniref:Threonine--tRNA ligase n=3 Tax=Taylorella equigenitalis TaxID=29575 RepID=A0A654KF97_TAYEM|nr:threonine--tRNA ligase [Taylorella equigenitalis]ADU91059.1 Threonyl-tRNA synthetase [Taylorella equigenitalis MCE9]AFN36162.1 threonyl-tRNA synthetase [Taylorella equigenitalis ATCC 35865]ASY30792.1 threonine--tRNA ligase [Taylorella equigenitalis]ASY38094.1 threonine--tRNA ligase [Taylorella equigenitalis]ASY39569.1 threonine--tRNA ligase [Taylorella equigenitalis]